MNIKGSAACSCWWTTFFPPFSIRSFRGTVSMEVNQLKRQLKDLGERIDSLRGFL